VIHVFSSYFAQTKVVPCPKSKAFYVMTVRIRSRTNVNMLVLVVLICFPLPYHFICSLLFLGLTSVGCYSGANTASGPTVTYPQGVDGVPTISLPSFGLASKFKGSLWTPTGGCEKQLASSLLQAADNWLRLHSVELPDYRFFTSHGAFRR